MLCEPGDETPMGVGFLALVQHLQHLDHIALKHGNPIEPQAWKDLALEHAAPVLQFLKPIAAEQKPFDRAIPDTPDHVLLDAVALVGAEFVVKVVARGGGRYFADPLRSALDVVLGAVSRLA